MIEVDRQPIETDVLIAGGGIGGLMAAINAADQGVRVIVAEKANTMRSGSGATGNDHFLCYIPEIHGLDLNFCIRVAQDSILGKFNDLSLVRHLFKENVLLERMSEAGWAVVGRFNGTLDRTLRMMENRHIIQGIR